MKRHLFYTFLWIFGITSAVTLLGVVRVIHIEPEHLTKLLWAFLIELAGACIALFRKTEFFAEDQHSEAMAKLKKAYEEHTVALEKKNQELVAREAQEKLYTPDPSWPGTATQNDATPEFRVCHRCLLKDHIGLQIVWDAVNKLHTCTGCGAHLRKP